MEPPQDPNEWTDEQWLEWLKSTDIETYDQSERVDPSVVERIARSVPGQAIGQAMLGMAQAIYGHLDEVAVVEEGSGENLDDEPFRVQLDPEHPERSSVVFRPDPEKPKPEQ
ncbi:MAG TPA: hypothetical protein VMU98_00780 [Acidimicrobiales bacterium]|nr:hypothetical protein [Acidimicrobiales bacterium]